MKQIDISSISPSAGMPVKSGTLAFLQQAYTEAISATIINLIGSNYNQTTLYRLTGCQFTALHQGDSTGPWSISAGYVFYNGEVFQVDAASFSYGGSVTGIDTAIVISQYTVNADPVTFTDSIQRNVHNIRKIVFSAKTTPTPPPLGLFPGSEFTDTSNYLVPVDIESNFISNPPFAGVTVPTNFFNSGWSNISGDMPFAYKLNRYDVTLAGSAQHTATLSGLVNIPIVTLPFPIGFPKTFMGWINDAAGSHQPIQLFANAIGENTVISLIYTFNSPYAPIVYFDGASFSLE